MPSIALASTLALSACGPASKKELNIIDLKAMTVERTVKLDEAAVEMAVVTGTTESSHADHSVNLR